MADRVRTIAVCCPQVPFARGGTELLAEALREQLAARGFDAELVTVPFRWYPREEIFRHCLAWRLLDLSESNGKRIDLVIATKFPSYVVRHERKVTWLFHQLRQAYDLLGTPYSDFGEGEEDRAARDAIARIDRRTLSESRTLCAISRTVAERLRVHNGLEATPLYPPPPGRERYRPGPMGDYVLCVARLEPIKRIGPLIEALAHTDKDLRCVVVGRGPESDRLRARAEALGVHDRVEFRAEVGFPELVELYAGALCIYYAPYREDYGYVTVESFLARKPVVTAPDAGGPLEFVEDGVCGYVSELEAERIGSALRALHADRRRAAEMGAAGFERVRSIDWDAVVERLVGT